MIFKIINNNDSDIHININNNPIDSIKAIEINIDSNTYSNIVMNDNVKGRQILMKKIKKGYIVKSKMKLSQK